LKHIKTERDIYEDDSLYLDRLYEGYDFKVLLHEYLTGELPNIGEFTDVYESGSTPPQDTPVTSSSNTIEVPYGPDHVYTNLESHDIFDEDSLNLDTLFGKE